MKQRIRRSIVGLSVVAASVVVPATAAMAVQSWVDYNLSYTDVMPLTPTFRNSSSSYNQGVWAAQLLSCSGGTWSKYINIRNSAGVIRYANGYAWAQLPNLGYYVGSSKSQCTKTSGSGYTDYAACYVLREGS